MLVDLAFSDRFLHMTDEFPVVFVSVPSSLHDAERLSEGMHTWHPGLISLVVRVVRVARRVGVFMCVCPLAVEW
jgi:hypothetical protein